MTAHKSLLDLLSDELGDVAIDNAAADRVVRLVDATDRAFRDAGHLTDVVEQYANARPAYTQGRAFEMLEALKFNQAAARAGDGIDALPTHFTDPAAATDITIRRAATVLAEAQTKSFTSNAALIDRLLDPKYEGMHAIVPADKVEDVRHLIDRKIDHLGPGANRDQMVDLRDRLDGALRVGDISSGGTTRAEAEAAVDHPGLVAARMAGAAALQEIADAAIRGAVVRGGTRAAFAAAANAIDVRSGRQSIAESVVETMRATAAAAVQGGVVEGGAQAIVITARQVEWTDFAASAAPRQVAQSVWNVAGVSRRYINGELDATGYRDEVGGELTQRLAAYYCGIAGQLLIPVPVVGGLVGGMVGHATAGILLEAGLISGGAHAELHEARRRRAEVEENTRLAIAQLEASRADIETLIDEHARDFRVDVLPALDAFDAAIIAGTPGAAVQALVALSRTFRSRVPFRTLEQFDAFMVDEATALTL